jgi:hypothetical protein
MANRGTAIPGLPANQQATVLAAVEADKINNELVCLRATIESADLQILLDKNAVLLKQLQEASQACASNTDPAAAQELEAKRVAIMHEMRGVSATLAFLGDGNAKYVYGLEDLLLAWKPGESERIDALRAQIRAAAKPVLPVAAPPTAATDGAHSGVGSASSASSAGPPPLTPAALQQVQQVMALMHTLQQQQAMSAVPPQPMLAGYAGGMLGAPAPHVGLSMPQVLMQMQQQQQQWQQAQSGQYLQGNPSPHPAHGGIVVTPGGIVVPVVRH